MSKRQKHTALPPRNKKRKRDDEDFEALKAAVAALDTSSALPASSPFSDLPLSSHTRSGLKAAHFASMTDIQARAIPIALQGRDILGAAKTGSGKTLAFLIPVLENLYRRHHVGKEAGMGALIISPTRELALQIFKVLQLIGGQGHTFSAGLIIGGKKSLSLQQEQQMLVRMNVVVCTPGRMLQHLSQAAFLNVDNLQMLVLDEADRILDMGFQRELDALLDYLPKKRQTLLFSATQSKRVSDLARLSLVDPEYISVHQEATSATPKGLTQIYILTPLDQKLDTLWSFIQTCKKSKILVFLSSAKQVRYVYEAFRHLQPGIPLLHLHGGQKQMTRLQVTKKFEAAQASCLFATDVVARGIDFPAVDWVVQADCPEDADTYIHRVGRTARYEREGQAVLFLEPSEELGMLQRLEAKKVPIQKVTTRGNKQKSIQTAVQNMCFKDAQLKYLAQKAFTSYVRSIYIQKDREIFQLDKLPLEQFATSLGLPGAPRIKFLAGADEAKARKNAPRAPLHSVTVDDDDSDDDDDKTQKTKTKYDRMFERQNQDVLAHHYNQLVDPKMDGLLNHHGNEEVEIENDDDFLAVKRRLPANDDASSTSDEDDTNTNEPNQQYPSARYVTVEGVSAPILIDSKRAEKRLRSKKAMLKYRDAPKHIVFDGQDGSARPLHGLVTEDEFLRSQQQQQQQDDDNNSNNSHSQEAKVKDLPAGMNMVENMMAEYLAGERAKIAHQDVDDKARVRERRREKKAKQLERKLKVRQEADEAAVADRDQQGGDGGGGTRLVLGPEDAGDRDLVAEFLQTAQLDEGDDDDSRKKKQKIQQKPKKWFRNDETPKDNGIDNFEEMESFAAGLLL